MNARQMAKELRDALRTAVWPTGTGAVVVGKSVYIVSDVRDDQTPERKPFVLLKVGVATSDDDDPSGLQLQEYDMVIATQVEGDPHDQGTMVGGPRTGGSGTSKGKGLLEIQSPLLGAIGALTGADGASIVATAAGVADVARIDGEKIATRAYTIKAWVHVDPFYSPPYNFTAADATGGDASLAWAAPSNRHDFVEVVVRRAAGATAPTSETGGTAVYTGTATSYTDSPGAGQFSYAMFAGFDDVEGSSSQSYSDQVTGTTRTVTVTS